MSATPQITTQPNLTARRQAMLHRRRQIAAKKVASKEQEDRNHCVALERERWLIERARATEVDPELLLPPPKSRAGRRSDAIGVAKIDDENNMEEGETDRESDTEDEGIGVIGVHSLLDLTVTKLIQAGWYNRRLHAGLRLVAASKHTRHTHHFISTALSAFIPPKPSGERPVSLCPIRSLPM